MQGSPIYVPRAPLSRFVAFFWHREGEETVWRRERLLPTGTVELVFELSRPKAQPVLCGPHNRPFFLDNPGSLTVLGAHFRPGGAFPFFRVPPAELQNRVIGLDEVWGSEAGVVRDRILEAGSLLRMYQVLETCLFEQGRGSLTRQRAVRYAIGQFERPLARVGDVTEQVGFSHRHLAEVFKGEVGLTPKQFARVKRFQFALEEMGMRNDPDLGELALNCGYFDQSHFTNDFKEIAGLTPSSYLALRTPHMNHVPVYE